MQFYSVYLGSLNGWKLQAGTFELEYMLVVLCIVRIQTIQHLSGRFNSQNFKLLSSDDILSTLRGC